MFKLMQCIELGFKKGRRQPGFEFCISLDRWKCFASGTRQIGMTVYHFSEERGNMWRENETNLKLREVIIIWASRSEAN